MSRCKAKVKGEPSDHSFIVVMVGMHGCIAKSPLPPCKMGASCRTGPANPTSISCQEAEFPNVE